MTTTPEAPPKWPGPYWAADPEGTEEDDGGDEAEEEEEDEDDEDEAEGTALVEADVGRTEDGVTGGEVGVVGAEAVAEANGYPIVTSRVISALSLYTFT